MSATQQKLARARAWSRAQVDAVFDERPDALQFFVEVLSQRALAGSRDAYPCLDPLLQRLLEQHAAPGPLAPLLESLVAFEAYDPDGRGQYEAVRVQAARLLARAKSPAAAAWIKRTTASFPIARESETAARLAWQLCLAATDLGDAGLAPPLDALLGSLLPVHSKHQRDKALADARALVAALARA